MRRTTILIVVVFLHCDRILDDDRLITPLITMITVIGAHQTPATTAACAVCCQGAVCRDDTRRNRVANTATTPGLPHDQQGSGERQPTSQSQHTRSGPDTGHPRTYREYVIDTFAGLWLHNDMTTAEQYTEARRNADAARTAFDTAKTIRARREAAEELEFWTGKAAHFGTGSVMRTEREAFGNMELGN
jgi:hypothetical protein